MNKQNFLEEHIDVILDLIDEHRSLAFIARYLCIKVSTLKNFLNKKGVYYCGNKGNRGFKINNSYKDAMYYIINNIPIASKVLKNKLIRDGLKNAKCECCGLSQWNGDTIPLELHHKDGNHYNNELDNLEILCSNCHSQKHKYCKTYILHNTKKYKNICQNCHSECYGKLCRKCKTRSIMNTVDVKIKEICDYYYISRNLSETARKFNYKCSNNLIKIFKSRKIPFKYIEFTIWYQSKYSSVANGLDE